MHEFDHDGYPGPGHFGFEHHGFPGNPGPGPGSGLDSWLGMLQSTANTLFWIALCIFLAWVLLKWVLPYLLPTFMENQEPETARPPALEILRQRYASGEIDAVTFEQMRERLGASYQEREQYPPS